MTSENLVAMPKRAEISIQNTAPGPPRAIAPVTPTMLPVPTVAARAVVTACIGVMAPFWASTFWLLSSTFPMVFFIA